MKLFRKKSAWERAAEKLPATDSLRNGAIAVAGVIGVSAASAVVSALRERQRSQ